MADKIDQPGNSLLYQTQTYTQCRASSLALEQCRSGIPMRRNIVGKTAAAPSVCCVRRKDHVSRWALFSRRQYKLAMPRGPHGHDTPNGAGSSAPALRGKRIVIWVREPCSGLRLNENPQTSGPSCAQSVSTIRKQWPQTRQFTLTFSLESASTGTLGKHWTDAGSMFGQRIRRWSYIQHTFDPFRVLPSGHNTLNQCCFKWTNIKNNIVCWVGRVNSQSRNFEPMVGYCLASVFDAGQTITLHWVKLGHWESDLLHNLLKIYLHRSRLSPWMIIFLYLLQISSFVWPFLSGQPCRNMCFQTFVLYYITERCDFITFDTLHSLFCLI